MKHKVDPVTGRSMTSRDLIMLQMDKDESTGVWQCPVLNKSFTNRTKIVAIKQPGSNEANVYSYEAYHELNVKAKNNLDLISGLKFRKEDVIVLQDPEDEAHCKLRDIANFKHTKQLREDERVRQDASAMKDEKGVSGNVRHSVTASRIMEKLDREKRKRNKAAEEEAKKLLKASDDGDVSSSKSTVPAMTIYTDELLSAITLTSGKASGSLTSTAMNITRENTARDATQDEIIKSQCEQLRRLKKKGTIRMFTNVGAMDVEIHCDIVPMTAMNFMLLAEKGEYDGSKFHRSIPNFMIQGGKRAKEKGDTGGEGSSYWGKPFQDEFDDRLTHTGAGQFSMANSGPATNGRQFFITYKSCAHLNRKHSVFGKVIRGIEVLQRMEQIPTNKDSDRPLETVKIESMEILDNPVSEALELERERILKRKVEKKELGMERSGSGDVKSASTKPVIESATTKTNADDHDNVAAPIAIGKYLKPASMKESKKKSVVPDKEMEDEVVIKSRLPPPPKKTTFGNFSGW